MKTARKVEVNEPVSADDHQDLLKHAKNSAEWYCGSSMKTESMISNKLIEKGYPASSVRLADGDSINYVEEALQYCRDLHIVHSEADYCERIAESAVRTGKGPLELRQKFMLKGIGQAAISECLDEYPTLDAIENGLPKALRSSGVRKAETERARNQKLIEYFSRKGFSFGDIREVLDERDLEE